MEARGGDNEGATWFDAVQLVQLVLLLRNTRGLFLLLTCKQSLDNVYTQKEAV